MIILIMMMIIADNDDDDDGDKIIIIIMIGLNVLHYRIVIYLSSWDGFIENADALFRFVSNLFTVDSIPF